MPNINFSATLHHTHGHTTVPVVQQ